VDSIYGRLHTGKAESHELFLGACIACLMFCHCTRNRVFSRTWPGFHEKLSKKQYYCAIFYVKPVKPHIFFVLSYKSMKSLLRNVGN